MVKKRDTDREELAVEKRRMDMRVREKQSIVTRNHATVRNEMYRDAIKKIVYA